MTASFLMDSFPCWCNTCGFLWILHSFQLPISVFQKEDNEDACASFAYLCLSIVLTGTICHQFQSCQFLKFFRDIKARDITDFCYETSYCCYSYAFYFKQLIRIPDLPAQFFDQVIDPFKAFCLEFIILYQIRISIWASIRPVFNPMLLIAAFRIFIAFLCPFSRSLASFHIFMILLLQVLLSPQELVPLLTPVAHLASMYV